MLDQRINTIEHVLSQCKATLRQDRYEKRHNKVLEVLAAILNSITKKKNE